jgi:glucose-6-phosphate isomerase
VGISLDISRVAFPDDYFKRMEPRIDAAFAAMKDLEGGEIANPDEQRMVGHYWLRAPHLAPNEQITLAIERAVADVMSFAEQIHSGEIAPPQAKKFTDLVVVGIGGSALGPQLIADALAARKDKLTPHFVDNTDPDGIERVVNNLGARLKSTLVVVISKSGTTKETRNGMVEMEAYFDKSGLAFGAQAVAVTGEGSQLEQVANA